MVAWGWCGRGWGTVCAGAALLAALVGCSPVNLVLGAAGVASDTSIPWEVVKHLHAQLTQGDAVPCRQLDSVQRALSPRCGAFVPGSLRVQDMRASSWQGCLLTLALQDPRLWPVVPELLDKGAQPEACAQSPLAELAQTHACPDFTQGSAAELASIRWVALADARAVQHDVVRMLSCPAARTAGLDTVLVAWLDQGELDVQRVGFGVLGALDPGALATPLALRLQAQGHTAQRSLGGFVGVQPGGFEAALRAADWAALDWWLARAPELVNRVPASRGDQLPWLPLARVLVPNFMADPRSRGDMVEFLIARGARTDQRLPYDASSTVLRLARTLDPALAALMDPVAPPATLVARAPLAGS